jgi:hypothetical protein
MVAQTLMVLELRHSRSRLRLPEPCFPVGASERSMPSFLPASGGSLCCSGMSLSSVEFFLCPCLHTNSLVMCVLLRTEPRASHMLDTLPLPHISSFYKETSHVKSEA